MNKKQNYKKKFSKVNTISKNRLVLYLTISFVLLIALVIRIGWIQFVEGSDLKKQAYEQQTAIKTLEAKRGTIYDSTGKALAKSADVDTVTVNPSKILYSNKEPVDFTFLANAFSTIFGLDYTETLEKLNTDSSNIKIASKVEHDKILILEDWLKSNKINSGIYVTADIKRSYPYDNLASNLIGFTGTDNKGLVGLENTLDDILSGIPGRVVTATDSINGEIPNQQQTYIEAQNGSDVTLTIDVNIQSIAEKYLSQAVNDNNADGGNVIIMNPSNGNILAMSTYPDYNLNTPFTPNTTELQKNWESLSSEEKSSALFKMWNNTAVQNTYEPGSTYKIITAATALEENLISPDNNNDFLCTGSEQVSSISINCWRNSDPHGYQSLRKALANSCNPAFIQLGRKIGASTLYKYYRAFGLFNTTNPFFYGESNSVFHKLENIREIELATMSFGQRFTITPIQLITAVSAISNERCSNETTNSKRNKKH